VIEDQMPALLTFGDTQPADHPRMTSEDRGEARCEVRVKHEALNEQRPEPPKLSCQSTDSLKRVSVVHVQAFAQHIRLP
jgi:hypothetical protein